MPSRGDSVISDGAVSSVIVNSYGDRPDANDDDQLFFVTSYSDFDKLGKSVAACYLLSTCIDF